MKGNTLIKVQGHLDKKWKDCFEGMDILYEGTNTILKGNLKDESHVHGILNRIRDLNLKLISVNPASENSDKKVSKKNLSSNIKKISSIFLLIIVFSNIVFGQNLTQKIRGTVIDIDSKLPIIGSMVLIVGTNPSIAASTDVNGNFKFENIPIGRITLQVSTLGYETQIIPNIEVNSGKEVILDINLQESVIKLDEIVVKANKKKGAATNDMSLLSARSISVEETNRYSGGFDDPGRMVSNYAGVASTADGSSDIIVRGNAPKYVQWRVEGIEISSPYHFDDQNASFGALSALNNRLLSTSDFYTGAFSPEYGNVLSSVFDVKLRPGNNEKFEAAIGAGLVGTDITIEGPFKKGYAGSYLINYRYSTASLVQDIGLVEVPGLFNFQDANLKLIFPTKTLGTFSLFAFGGLDNFSIKDIRASILSTPGNRYMTTDESEDYNKANFLFNSGLNHTLTINKNSFIKTSLSFSGNGISDEIFENKNIKLYNAQGEFIRDSVRSRKLNFDNNITKSVYRGAITYNHKLSTKNKIQIGIKYNLHNYNFKQSILNNDSSMFTSVNFKENVSTIQNFISWQYRLNDKITFVAGIHNMNVLLNNKSTLEPRIALNWKLNERNSFHAGYGNHSTMESIHHYFARVKQDDGSVIEPNKDLDLLKAHHYVIGYEKRFTTNLMAKVELYYQYLYNLPVENNDTSYFATINEGMDYRYVDLVNKGTGKNYGIEITLERFFDNNYYFLINATLYNSKYKTLEGVERNTQFNQNYLSNILFGKEFRGLGKNKNRTVGINCKIFFQGGRKIIPLLRDANNNLAVDPATNSYWDYEKAYNNSLDNLYQINISVSYKWNKQKTTHELYLDLQNLTNNTAKINEFYDLSEPNSVGNLKQFGFFPNLTYKVYF